MKITMSTKHWNKPRMFLSPVHLTHSRFAALFFYIAFFLFPLGAYAGFQVVGPIKAEDCYNFGVKICSTKTVTEVRKDGKRFEISNYFEKVSEYNNSNNMCYITTKSTDWGFLSMGINVLTQPNFWGYDKEGKFVKIDADYIYFKCIKN